MVWNKQSKKGGDVYSSPSTFYTSATIHLNDANPTADFPRSPINSHNPTHPHPSTQRDAPSEVGEVEQVERVRRFPAHLLVRTPDPYRGRVSSALSLEREGCGGWRGDDSENIWRVDDLDLEILTVRRAVELDQDFHQIDHCNARSIYAPWNVIQSELARMIPGLVPIDGGDRVRGNVGKRGWVAIVGGECVSHDLVAPHVLQGPDALNGDVEAPGEGYVSV
jgi:hypothetical protein